jgi:hypothetical protein
MTAEFTRLGNQIHKGQLLLRASRDHMMGRTIDLRAAIIDGPHVSLAQPLVMAEADECAPMPPFMSLGMDTAQVLMDELWNCGLRPSEGTGSAGAMAAVQAHLQDLRRLVPGLVP